MAFFTLFFRSIDPLLWGGSSKKMMHVFSLNFIYCHLLIALERRMLNWRKRKRIALILSNRKIIILLGMRSRANILRMTVKWELKKATLQDKTGHRKDRRINNNYTHLLRDCRRSQCRREKQRKWSCSKRRLLCCN